MLLGGRALIVAGQGLGGRLPRAHGQLEVLDKPLAGLGIAPAAALRLPARLLRTSKPRAPTPNNACSTSLTPPAHPSSRTTRRLDGPAELGHIADSHLAHEKRHAVAAHQGGGR